MTDDRRAAARQGLGIYFTLLVVISSALEGYIIMHGGLAGPAGGLVFPLMWTPAVSSLIARLIRREGIADVSFKWGGRLGTRAFVIAWLSPAAIGLVAYGIAWNTGLAQFAPPAQGWLADSAPALRFAARLARMLTVGTVLSAISAFGEELGWRGYMVSRLVEAGVKKPGLVSGLIWCTWHVPLILWGGYAVGPYPLLSVALFFGAILPVALLVAKWRLSTGSVWPAVMAHAAWNAVIQAAFDASSQGDRKDLWIGESGILVVATTWVACWVVLRRMKWEPA